MFGSAEDGSSFLRLLTVCQLSSSSERQKDARVHMNMDGRALGAVV